MNRKPTLCFICAAAATVAILSPAAAGTFTVDAAGDQITVEANAAGIEEILTRIGQSKGFVVEQIGESAGEPVAGRISGPLRTVIDRLLQNDSHVIIHSKSAPSGIARIVLLDSNTVAEPPPAIPATATPAALPAARGTATAAAALAAPTQSPQPLPREVAPPWPGGVPPVRTGRR